MNITSHGTFTFPAGQLTAVVPDANVTADCIIKYDFQEVGVAYVGPLGITGRDPGVSFTIRATKPPASAVVGYVIYQP
jgi:hypothetical protein